MFEKQMGFRQHLLCDDRDTRHGVKSWLERVLAAYGAVPCVDIQVIAGQLILNRTTADCARLQAGTARGRARASGG